MHYYPKYHITGEKGWINDPNGFSYYKGYYHLFFQYYPKEPLWGPMHWGHVRSKDLVHWEHLPIALTPGDKEDLNGCFSGSAIEYNNRLYLIYTGNIYDDEDHITFHQNVNIAYSDDGIHFHKYKNNPVITAPPADNTHHFRDPKVWKENDHFKMIIGGQKKDGRGHVLLYQSYDLIHWEYLKEYKHALLNEGKIWECPDLMRLNGEDILLISPQGIQEESEKYRNYHQTGYFKNNIFTELDHGHDFYATHTMLAPDGRRILIAWMDMWHSEFPEKEEGWSGVLTFPRELTIHDHHLYMMPIVELSLLRKETIEKEIKEYTLPSRQVEIDIPIDNDFYLEFKDSFVSYTISIQNLKVTVLNKTERTGYIKNYISIKILMDSSSIELFINNGELVFSDRVYFKETPLLLLHKKTLCKITTLG